jgi:sulfite reductase beta subunit-like hemoprotein
LPATHVAIRQSWHAYRLTLTVCAGCLVISCKHTQLPNGEINAEQLRYAASAIRKYGEDGCADITTRANLQLRGVKLEDADGIIEGLIQHNMGSFQSGMDSVRNLTGSPIAGLDPHELFDTRWADCFKGAIERSTSGPSYTC